MIPAILGAAFSLFHHHHESSVDSAEKAVTAAGAFGPTGRAALERLLKSGVDANDLGHLLLAVVAPTPAAPLSLVKDVAALVFKPAFPGAEVGTPSPSAVL